MKDNTITFLIRFASLLAILFSCGIVLYANIILTLEHLFPELDFIKIISDKMPDLRFLILTAILSGLIGWMGKFKLHEVRFTSPLELAKKDLLIILIISFSLTHYYIRSFPFLSYSLLNFGIIISSLFIIIIQITQLAGQLTKKKVKDHLKELIHINNESNNFIIKLFSVIIISLCTILLFNKALEFNKYERLLNNSFIISDVRPEKTTYAHKVTVKGYNLGPVKTDKHILYSQYGPVNYQTWDNDKIEFIVPLHWKEGKIELRVEKPASIEKRTKQVSNTSSFTLLSRWEFYPTVHDNVFIRGIKKFLRIVYLD